MEREYPEVVVEHVDYGSIELSQSKALHRKQVRPADGSAAEYRQGYRNRLARSDSQRCYSRLRYRIQAIRRYKVMGEQCVHTDKFVRSTARCF